jgi:hypothetical protein
MKVASVTTGRITGVVRDQRGQGIAGVAVLALGETLATTRSDSRGHFAMALPAGEYVLRATHAGYVSNYREPVRVRSSVRLERNITLVPLGVDAVPEPILASLALEPAIQPGVTADEVARPEHPHSIAAWWLRRLSRSILRDGGNGTSATEYSRTEVDTFRQRTEVVGRTVLGTAGAAASLIGQVDFTGQVNFLATSLRDASTGWRPDDWAQGVAFMSVGAPVGRYGHWQARGALRPGDLSSWVLDGQYASRDDLAHAFRVGLSHGVQGDLTLRGRRVPAGTETRSVSAVHFEDRWQVARALAIRGGLRFDRYDYVESPHLLSPSFEGRLAVRPGTVVVGSASQRATAPGAAEFLPPSTDGLWLPPERTFSTLLRQAPFRAERVEHYSLGVEQAVGAPDRVLFVRRFRESAANQIATVFGLDRDSDVGHYYVAAIGHAELDAWQVGLSGALLPQVRGTVGYTTGRASWTPGPESGVVRWFAPSAARRGVERTHDLAFAVDADLAETDTDVRLAYRFNTRFARPRSEARSPGAVGRFDLEVRQGLPYQPIPGGRLEAVVALRNLFTDPFLSTSFYDEVLTVTPPLRLLGGIQIRF